MTDTAEVKTSNMETSSALPPEETERLGGEIVAALKTVFDPEIPADIYELGLIYKVDIKDDRTVDVEMTLTTPNCPAAWLSVGLGCHACPNWLSAACWLAPLTP